MAIKLSRDLKQQTTTPEGTGTSKGIDIAGTPGTNYDLDTISSGKSRTSNDVLRTQVGSSNKTGSMSVKSAEARIVANNADAVKYLFKNEPSTDAYTPAVTLRRPIVVWEEGDTPYTPLDSNGSIHDTVYELESEISRLKRELSSLKNAIVDDIEFYNDGALKSLRDSIPTVGATYDFIRNNIKFSKEEDKVLDTIYENSFSLKISNSNITPIDGSTYAYNLDLSGIYYDCKLIDGENNYYEVILGGK